MTPANDDVYYLYVGNGWSGPFRIEQIRLFVKEKQIALDTYAFEPQQQMQLTVAQLLTNPADADTGSFQSATPPAQRSGAYEVLDKSKSQSSARMKIDNDTIDLDAVSTVANTKVKATRDDDVIDLDQVSRDQRAVLDQDVIDLDSGSAARDSLSIEIDEPRGRPAESTIHGRSGTSEALEVVLGELENLRKAYNALMENSIKDREEAQQKVHVSHIAINEVLEERKADIAEIRSLVAEIDQVATDLAKRHRDSTLSTRIIRLRDSLVDSDVSQMVQFAEAVVRRIVEQYDRQSARDKERDKDASTADPFAVFDEAKGPPPAPPSTTERQLLELRKAYDTLHAQQTQEQNLARERLLSATALLEGECEVHSQDVAELKALINEVYRLACDIDPLWMTSELYQQVQKLWQELSDPNCPASAIAPTADQVLTDLVTQLKERAQLADEPLASELTATRSRSHGELSTIRADLLQTRTDLTLLKQRELALEEEKARLGQLLDEQKQISEKAQQAAKAREHRLRSTVSALEVTKELHQDVMRDLQTQLAQAQGKVEQMELDLRQVRGELTARRERAPGQGDDLHAEMRRVVEMRAMLDARKQELSKDLKSTEDELQRVSVTPGQDQELTEALAAKVNHIRATYEQTLARLADQETKASRLQGELDESRREAGELRGRSDLLNSELENARSHLSSAKKRVDELHQAYERLEAERESLASELVVRRTTTTVVHADGDQAAILETPSSDSDLVAQLQDSERRQESLQNELARERRRAEDLVASSQALQSRIQELTNDRNQLKADSDRMIERYSADQQRLTAAIASATQTAIESEARMRQAASQVEKLEQLLTAATGAAGAASASAELAGSVGTQRSDTRSFDRSKIEIARLQREKDALSAELAEAKRQQLASLELLTHAKSAVALSQSHSSAAGDAQARSRELAERLATTEADLAGASHTRALVHERLLASEAEVARLHRELESAANEHRAALGSARNRLLDEQARGHELELELTALRSQAQVVGEQRESIAVAMAKEVSAKERMTTEVRRLQEELGLQSQVSSDQLDQLTQLQGELARSQDQVLALSAQLSALEASSLAARVKVPELEGRLERSAAERSQLLAELDGLRSEVVTLNQSQRLASASTAELEAMRQKLLGVTQAKDAAEESLTATSLEINRLRAKLTEMTQLTLDSRDALSAAESRYAIESSRFQSVDEMLMQAREQARVLTSERDQARLRLARVEAEHKDLTTTISRQKTELNQLRTTAPGSPMPASSLSAESTADLEHAASHAAQLAQALAAREARLSAVELTLAQAQDTIRMLETKLSRGLAGNAGNAGNAAGDLVESEMPGDGQDPATGAHGVGRPEFSTAGPTDARHFTSGGLVPRSKLQPGRHVGVPGMGSVKAIDPLFTGSHTKLHTAGIALAAATAVLTEAPPEPSSAQAAAPAAPAAHSFTSAHGRVGGGAGGGKGRMPFGSAGNPGGAGGQLPEGQAGTLNTARFNRGQATSTFKPGPNARSTTTVPKDSTQHDPAGAPAEGAEGATKMTAPHGAMTRQTEVEESGTMTAVFGTISDAQAQQRSQQDHPADPTDPQQRALQDPNQLASGKGRNATRQGILMPPLRARHELSTRMARPQYQVVAAPTAPWTQTVTAPWQNLSQPNKILLGVAAGGAVCVLGLWWLAMGLPTTSTAVVNADVAVMKAPIEGTVQELGITTGSKVRAGQEVLAIHNDWVDETHLHTLQMNLHEATTAKATADAAVAAATQELASKTLILTSAHQSTVSTAAANQQALQAAVADAKETLKLRQLVLGSLSGLKDGGKIQESDLTTAKLQVASSADEVSKAEAALASAAQLLTQAKETEAKAQTEVDLATSTLAASTAAQSTQAEAIVTTTAACSAEEKHLAALRDAQLTSALSGPVWMLKVTAGATVQAGTPILEVADPTTISIEAVLDGENRSKVHVGDLVRVYLPGTATTIDGHITRFASDDDAVTTRAQDLGPVATDSLRAYIDFNAPVKTEYLGQSCDVVVIGDHSILGNLVGWAYFRMKF